jgi:hypothetical protein
VFCLSKTFRVFFTVHRSPQSVASLLEGFNRRNGRDFFSDIYVGPIFRRTRWRRSSSSRLRRMSAEVLKSVVLPLTQGLIYFPNFKLNIAETPVKLQILKTDILLLPILVFKL